MAEKLDGTDKRLEIVFELLWRYSVPVDFSKFLKKRWTRTTDRYCRKWVELGIDISTQDSCPGNFPYSLLMYDFQQTI